LPFGYLIRSLVNGEAGSRLSILDRGLQFGDGLFETIAVVDGEPALWRRHLERLSLGCRQLGIPAPDPALLEEEAREVIGDEQAAVLKIIVTRGESERGYRPPSDSRPSRILELFSWPGPTAAPASLPLVFCRQRLGFQPGYAGLKHLNRLEQVLARREFEEGEGLMLDTEGFVVEGTLSNLFLVIRGELHTPLIERCGVAGVVRSLVLDVARELHRPVNVRRILPEELMEAEGLFLTGSLLGIVPVDNLAGSDKAVKITHHPVMEAAAQRVFTKDG